MNDWQVWLVPFKVSKEEAFKIMKNYFQKRALLLNKDFKSNFKEENLQVCYYPLYVVDANLQASFSGLGEILDKEETKKIGNEQITYYDASSYIVERDFDLNISDYQFYNFTSVIVKKVAPFDLTNLTPYNESYLQEYTFVSDNAYDANIVNDELKKLAKEEVKDKTTKFNRGIVWAKEDINLTSFKGKIVYVPIYLYRYQNDYICLNGVNKKINSFYKIDKVPLIVITIVLEVIGFILCFTIKFPFDFLFLGLGFYFYFYYIKYFIKKEVIVSNEAIKKNISNLRENDTFREKLTQLTNAKITGYKE